MLDLYLEKIKRMSDEGLMRECEHHGRVMEKAALSVNLMSASEKFRATTAFTEASKREGLASDRDMMLVALRVLRLL